ncbi:MAG: FG-GAP repeat protein [Myxacorys chilensis ATA2-1-KO14]|jgi:hypothetical protein|nr:FG-GAP repeat protein [Myxacorys chilensis ATA2-1-KO14]
MNRRQLYLILVVSAISGLALLLITQSTAVWRPQVSLLGDTPQSRLRFGTSLDISLPYIVVGAPLDGDPGTAYVFIQQAGVWRRQARLIPSEKGLLAEGFGGSVSIDRDVIAVSAASALRTSTSSGREGVVYIFQRRGQQWIQQARLFPPLPSSQSYLKGSVALKGDTLAVGEQDAVHIFNRDRQTDQWIYAETLTASQPRTTSFNTVRVKFGPQLALSETTLAVGGDSVDGGNRLTIFTRNSTTKRWIRQAELFPKGADEQGFGHSLALENNTLVVGSSTRGLAPWFHGSASVFERHNDQWQRVAVLKPRGRHIDIGIFNWMYRYGFGAQVAIHNGYIAVIAQDSPDLVSLFGSNSHTEAFLFQQEATTKRWRQQTKLLSAQSQQQSFESIKITSDEVMVGDIGAQISESNDPTGAVHIFRFPAK